MAARRILIFPDPKLRRKADSIDEVTESIRNLASDMLQTMYDAPGIGLAGPQVGAMKRLFVMDCSPKDEEPEPRVLLNPEVVWTSDETEKAEEGCLSFPNQFADVVRPTRVIAKFVDLDGNVHEEEFDGISARCVQHEIDHLNGRLFIDHVSLVKRQLIKKKLAKEIQDRRTNRPTEPGS